MIAPGPVASRPILLPPSSAAAGVLMRCPHCLSTVEPARTASGTLLCPVCRNTGNVAAGAAPVPGQAMAPIAVAPPPPPLPAAPVPGSAVASMVIGIVGVLFIFTFVLAPLSLVLGIVALALGIPALRQVKAMAAPGVRLPGRPIAVTGIATGAVSAALGLLFAIGFAVFFVWLSDLEMPEGSITLDTDAAGPGGRLTVTGHSGFGEWSEFEVTGSADCDLPFGSIDVGDTIECYSDGSVRLREVATGEIHHSGSV